ncbi:5-bromo-4-chloroindolyl phosphate hydrolysis family protein [Cognatishimia sp. SS12]|uniref:5-bromo-4-chloroindolyl phosphate hydrolysis family protein n=1 Tax=Cognatishimia sp. SS12 TaxID=2979465 RepID=UPI00232BB542|nr:5-bromo-4-chloroindolyl phosphate hydrolysis family protein [Cognatishimia sp. SS12]MDC0738636.1 5-bromo-4-chloroindolyl phosphate hydrolysis family protein [Cognatishimia sp. SS12]
MAQRYGGKYSPESAPGQGDTSAKRPERKPGQYQHAKRSRAGGRVNALFLLPLPLIWKAFTSEPIVMAQYLLALGLLILAAWLTREGLLAQEAFEARKVARRPSVPRKMLGSALTGLGLGMAGLAGFGAIEAAIFAVLGAALHSMSFGLDPLRNKGTEGVDMYQTDRVARAVEEAEKHITAMQDAIKRSGDRMMQRRVEQFVATARELFRGVENDPRDLTAARKYLTVYLKGARDATIKFADVYSRNQSDEARVSYAALLDDLEQNFAARTGKLLENDNTDLSIEIDVLRERLQREGV